MKHLVSLGLLVLASMLVGACTLLPINNKPTPTPTPLAIEPEGSGLTIFEKLVESVIRVRRRPTPTPTVTQVSVAVVTPSPTATRTPTLTATPTLTPTIVTRAFVPTATATPLPPPPVESGPTQPAPSPTPAAPTPLPPEAPGGGGGHDKDTPKPNIRFSGYTFIGPPIGFPADTVPIYNNVNEATKLAVITITLEFPVSSPVKVQYKTRANTALAHIDYTISQPKMLVFPPGATVATAAIPINNDILNEAPESFFVDLLNNSTNADLLPTEDTGEVRITDDDPPPSVRFASPSYIESEDAGSSTIGLELSPPSGRDVTVFYFTKDGTANAGPDYVPILPFGARTFSVDPATGQTANTAQSFDVTLNDDFIDEFDEDLNLELSANPTEAIVAGTNPITLTIIDNDAESQLSISDSTVIEGDTGIKQAVFTVTLSVSTTKPVTVTYATTNSTAVAGLDYSATTGTLVFAPSETTKTINVDVLSDIIDEFTETFTVSLSNPVNAILAVANGTGTIIDDDALPQLLISDSTLTEGDAGKTLAVFTVTVTGNSEKPMAVDYATANNSATANIDYKAANGTLNFSKAPTVTTIAVIVNGDTLYEQPDPEEFFVNLFNPINVSIVDNQATGAIINDDPAPTLSISSTTITEKTGTSTTANFTVTLSNPHYQDVTVNYSTQDNTAVAPGDYTAVGPTLLTIPGGSVTGMITVVVAGDTLDEFTETFTVSLSAPVNAAIAVANATGTIIDDDPEPSLSISGSTATEGDLGSSPSVFTVTLSGASQKPVTVSYKTADGTAAAGSDYANTTGLVAFAPLAVSRLITVPVLGDTVDEFNETFTVSLSNPVNATIAITDGIGSILDDDAAPTLSINNAAVTEGNAGTANAVLTMTLSAPSEKPITVNYGTENGSAFAPGLFADYAQIPATTLLALSPGQTTAAITAVVFGDTIFEPNENFFIKLITPTNATTATAQGTVTIINDDAQPTLSISNTAVTEADTTPATALFTVTLSHLSYQNIQVDYATADGSAIAPGDYTTVPSTTLTFIATEQQKTIPITVQGDTIDEFDETFLVNLGNAVNAAIAGPTGIGTILDNDPQPGLTISNAGNLESAGHLTFTVNLSAASEKPVTVTYTTANNTATDTGDYATQSGSLFFSPGDTTKLITVTINDDTSYETDETFFVTLGIATNAGVAIAQGIGTIFNDDALPAVQFSRPTFTESEAAGSAVITAGLSAAAGVPVTVTYQTIAGGTATAGTDYTPVGPAQLVFNPGVTTQSITIPGINDAITNEPNETVLAQLSSPLNATLGPTPVATVTITDDDGLPTVQFSSAAYSLAENDGSGQAAITVTLSAESAIPVTVTYTTGDGSATLADNDYTAAGGNLVFSPGPVLAQSFAVSVTNDIKDETDETVNLTLPAATNAVISSGSAILTITNDDPPPALSISDTTISEADGSALFTVTLSAISGKAITVTYATTNSTAIAGSDYTAVGPVQLLFAPGEISKTIAVPVAEDLLNELDETFFVDLSGVINATIADSQGVGTITDNDAAPDLSINKISSSAAITMGERLTYTITVTNPGPSTATNVVLTDTTDPVSKISLASISGACTNSTSGADFIVTCNIGDLPPGTVTTTIAFTVTGNGGSINNNAEVTSTGPDPVSPNTSAVSVTIN